MIAPISRIIPFSLVDGPGSRIAIFFQGCGFNCKYCHNPETIQLCCSCGGCLAVCPTGAVQKIGEVVRWDRAQCCDCDACIAVCPNSSSPKVRGMSVQELMDELAPQMIFARGITASGGECTLYDAFLTALFERVHAAGKTAFIDTNGQRDFRTMPALVAQMDAAMLDVKSTDEQEHRMLTGSAVSVVLNNLDYLLEQQKLFEIRTVVVPGLLDSARTVDAASRIIGRAPQVRYKLIKFRTWGVRGEMSQTITPSDEEMEVLKQIALGNGVQDVVII